MSLPEQAGKVATGAISALAGTPTLLVMVILNLGMIGAAAWFLQERSLATERVIIRMMATCHPGPAPTGGPMP